VACKEERRNKKGEEDRRRSSFPSMSTTKAGEVVREWYRKALYGHGESVGRLLSRGGPPNYAI
jgi:hypothetical protein